MNMTNMFYLTGSVKTKPELEEGLKEPYTHVTLSTTYNNQNAVFDVVAYGDIACRLAKVAASTIIMVTLSAEEVSYYNKATNKSKWKTVLTVHDFTQLIASDSKLIDPRAHDIDAKAQQQHEKAINDVITNEFL